LNRTYRNSVSKHSLHNDNNICKSKK